MRVEPDRADGVCVRAVVPDPGLFTFRVRSAVCLLLLSLIQPRDRAELQPPLAIDNPLMIPALAASTPHHASSHHHSAHSGHDGGDEDKWLSQV